MLSRLALPLVAALALACGAPPPEPVASAAASPSTKPPAQDEARRLASTAVTGDDSAARAVREVQAQLGRLPDKADLWVELGRTWVRKARVSGDPGFYIHAAAAADVALELAPEHPEADNLKTLVLLNRHDFAGARDHAKGVLARDPDNAMALGSLSDALLELGDIDGAEAAVQAMLDRKPNMPAYARASWLRWLRGDVAGAQEAIRLAYESGRGQPDVEPSAWTLVQAALLFWHEGDLEGAEAGLDLALGLLPDYPPALVARARVALAREQFAAAIELLTRADAADPLAETAWLLGDARAAAGDVAGAERAYAEVKKRGLQGDGRTLALFLATHNQEPAEALRLTTAERKTRGGTYTDDAHAWALFRSGDVAAAKAMIDPVVALGTRDASLWYHAGAIALAAGDTERGKQLLQQALAQNPAFDRTGAREARELLAKAP